MSYSADQFDKVFLEVLRATGRPDTVATLISASEQERVASLINDALEEFWEYSLWPGTVEIEQRTIDATDRFVLKAEDGETEIGEIDERECFFSDVPQPGSLEFALGFVEDRGDRIVCFDDDCPEEPYIRFQVPVPVFTRAAYAAGTTYGKGEPAYDPTTGECYKSAQAANAGNAVTDTDWWTMVPFPAMARKFVKWAASAEWMAEDDGKYKQAAKARRELERLEDKFRVNQAVGR